MSDLRSIRSIHRKATLTPYVDILEKVKSKEIKAVGSDIDKINETVSNITTNSINYNILEVSPSIIELVCLFQDRPKTENYMNPDASMYTMIDGLKLVKYEDSQMIHTEGNAYAMYLLATMDDRAISDIDYSQVQESQKLFDQIFISSKKYFGTLAGTSLMPWVKDSKDTATDAEVFRLMSLIMAQRNVNKGLWLKSDIDYRSEIKRLSKDILNNSVLFFKTDDGRKMAIPYPGSNFDAPNKSYFVKETESEYIFHYNMSYSFSYVANLLSSVDERWEIVKETQNRINKIILANQGLPDWCVVRVNKKTGEVLTSKNNIQDYFPKAEKHTISNSYIEWPRFVLDHALNYRDYKEQESYDFLRMIAKEYQYNLKTIPFGGYISGRRNEINIAQSMITTLLEGKLNYDSVVEYRRNVFRHYGHYGLTDEHTFNQLIVAMTMNVVESMVADELKKDVISSKQQEKDENELIVTFPLTTRLWDKDLIARFDPDGILVIEGRNRSYQDFENVIFGNIQIPEGYNKLEVEVIDIGKDRIWGDKAFSVFLNEDFLEKFQFHNLQQLGRFPAPKGREIDPENKMIAGGINKGDVFEYEVTPGKQYQMGMIVFCNHENNMILRFSLKK